MNILFLDFETYFDGDYSLRKMAPPNYILDPRYRTILVAVKVNDEAAKIVDAEDFPDFLSQFDPADTVTVTHNALFDNCILAWHYGFVPRQMIDTLGMARALLGHKLKSLSLSAVSEHLGLGHKSIETLLKVQGLTAADMKRNPSLWADFRQYAINDVNLCAAIYSKLAPDFPKAERRIMDLVLRCAVQPQFLIDTKLLEQHLADLRKHKDYLLTVAATHKEALMSTEKFKQLLEARGVDIEYKTSPAGNKVPAFAKTDAFMDELAANPDPIVQALAAARLGHKSTIEETRAERLLSIAGLAWHTLPNGDPRIYSGGTFPVPLRYAGAHTHRLSGEWKINPQNMPSSRAEGSKLRMSIIAPPGHKVIVTDSGQIEARLTAWFCGQASLLDQFAKGLDPYAILATSIFGYECPGKDSFERFIGKGGVLGLGFGCGDEKFYNMVLRSARLLKMDMQELNGKWTRELAKKAVDTYRTQNFHIKNKWYDLNRILGGVWRNPGPGFYVTAPVTIGYGYVQGPGGLKMLYANPRQHSSGEKVYDYGGRTYKIHGAHFLENIIQFLARIVIMNTALRLESQGLRFVLQAHDELVYILPDEEVDHAKQLIYKEMIRRPSWAKDLPLKADIGVGQAYGECK